jgi:hypothetical protein
MRTELSSGALALVALMVAGAVEARPPPEDIPPPPRIPYAPGSEELAEPQVTIIERADRTIEEYRVNGRLVLVKVTPEAGPPYYLVDRSGDGLVDERIDDIDEASGVVQWVILRF